jgi:hypothetical protein
LLRFILLATPDRTAQASPPARYPTNVNDIDHAIEIMRRAGRLVSEDGDDRDGAHIDRAGVVEIAGSLVNQHGRKPSDWPWNFSGPLGDVRRWLVTGRGEPASSVERAIRPKRQGTDPAVHPAAEGMPLGAVPAGDVVGCHATSRRESAPCI